ncbi:ROK family protein [Streptomyces sp. NPDC006393]|uniref:ROK family protein n=1 Tax=Streptomyces sp. NPDC006393 TaxID=3156763 RepID=UPI0033DB5F72
MAAKHNSEAAEATSAVLGLDIGGTKLAAGVVGADGTVHSFLVTPTLVQEGVQAVLARLFDLGHKAMDESELAPQRIAAVGIGCGGPLDPEAGVLLCPPHLPGWIDVPITRLTEDRYGLPAVLDNDATAAATGEHRFGAGRGTRHMIYLTVSTGVGGGIVVDGCTYRGAAGNGGELGHVTVDRNGRHCRGCGRAGCLEAYVSGTSIAERAREAVAEAEAAGRPTTLSACSPLTAADVSREAAAQDAVATQVWVATTQALACGVTSLVNVFEPELVVLGGGVTRAGEQLLAPVRRIVRERAMGPAAHAVRIEPARSGDRVGVVGAAAVAFERVVTTTTGPEGNRLHG